MLHSFVCSCSAKSSYLHIWSKTNRGLSEVGWAEVEGAAAAAEVVKYVRPELQTWQWLVRPWNRKFFFWFFFIVFFPSPVGHWLVWSCEGRKAHRLSIFTLPLSGTFPHRVLTTKITSFFNRNLAHLWAGLKGSDYLYWQYCSFFKHTTTNKNNVLSSCTFSRSILSCRNVSGEIGQLSSTSWER